MKKKFRSALLTVTLVAAATMSAASPAHAQWVPNDPGQISGGGGGGIFFCLPYWDHGVNWVCGW